MLGYPLLKLDAHPKRRNLPSPVTGPSKPLGSPEIWKNLELLLDPGLPFINPYELGPNS